MEGLKIKQDNSQTQELQRLFTQQKDCYMQKPHSSYENRMASLTALYDLIQSNQQQICEAINKDFGNRPYNETKVLEIFPVLESIKYKIKNLKSWMKPRPHKTSIWFAPSKSYVIAQPKGVVGIISPWNYPLLLSVIPVSAALAAGNRVMIKLSEYTPHFADLLNQLISSKFVESKCVAVQGNTEVAAEFSSLAFDHLFFTGSTQTGQKVYEAASKNLVPVTLELGGKSPAVLADDIDRKNSDNFIDRIWLGKLINSGQTCIAPDYIWLKRGAAEQLLKTSQRVVKKRFQELNSKEYCSIINKSNYERIIHLIKEAVDKGAVWRPFANPWHSSDNNIYKIAPGLLLNCNHSMAIMQQEIFGPVMPVMEYDEFDEIFRVMQVVPRPLALYLFTTDKNKQEAFVNNTISGSLSFNNTVVHAAQESLPFGGIGHSGIGCYRGKYGFETFSMLKPIYKQSKIEIFSKFYPPTKNWQKKLLNFMLK